MNHHAFGNLITRLQVGTTPIQPSRHRRLRALRWLKLLLLPLSWIYALAVAARNALYDAHLLPSRRTPLPTICIGNLTAGGTGKTPHTELLIRLLQPHYRIAVLSRGYGRRTSGYIELADPRPHGPQATGQPADTSERVGDEPLQLKRKHPDVPVAVDANRNRGLDRLAADHPEVQLVLLDDAYQHRSTRASLYVLLTTCQRPYFADLPLPTGYLRDNRRQARRARVIITTKCDPQALAEVKPWLLGGLNPRPGQLALFSTMRYERALPLDGPASIAFTLTPRLQTFGLCAIAQPIPFITYLQEHTTLRGYMALADHHAFTPKDIRRLFDHSALRRNPGTIVITTEKDAQRLRSCALSDEQRRRIFYLPISAQLLGEGTDEQLLKTIKPYVDTH